MGWFLCRRLAWCVALAAAVGGASAQKISAREPRLLLDAARVGGQVIAVGEWGAVRRTSGSTGRWERVASPTEETLTAVQFINERHGVAVGHHGVVMISDDAGASWQLRTPDARSTEPLLGVHFLSPQHGFLVGTFGTLLETDDGARSFRPRDIGQGDRHLKAIAGSSEGDIYIASEEGAVFCSNDRGRSFRRSETGYAGSFWGVVVTESVAIAYGMRGTVYRSHDRCKTWTAVDSRTQAGLSAAAQVSAQQVVLAGADGVVLFSADEGRSFSALTTLRRTAYTAAVYLGADDVLLLGRGEPFVLKLSKP